MTLTQAAFGQQTLLKKALMVLGGTMFIAIAAQISVPMFPVPMTLQSLAILMIGFAYGSRLGAITLLAYLAEGAMGLPVFANGLNAVAFAGPTAGFLIGFVGLAFIAGLATDRGLRNPVALAGVAIVASALLYIPGLAWPAAIAGGFGIDAGWVGLSADKLFAGFMTPFLIGDVVKSVLAALIVSGAWTALKSRQS